VTDLPHLAIVNPAAGGGKCGKQFPAALEKLRGLGVEVDVVETSAPGQASALVREAFAAGRRHFIAVGGDGTGYEIVNGLFPRAADVAEDDRPTLGFLPLGTGNSFLRDFSEEGAEYSMAAIAEGRSRPCDVMRMQHATGEINYINLAGIGFAADVNARAARYKSLGDFGYILAVILETLWLRRLTYRMTVDGESMEQQANFICFNNSKFTGGNMKMAPQAATDDGRVDMVSAGPMGRVSLLATLPKVFTGKHVEHPRVGQRHATTIEFDLDEELDVMVDGEALRLRPTRLDVLPGALLVRV
jgi:YegS/Rv2252/BmrU family lipid kinase